MQNRRVVITGMGVVAPNANNLDSFKHAIQNGISGIRFIPRMQALNLGCQVAGIPEFNDAIIEEHLRANTYKSLKSTGVKYACTAALEAWYDAELDINKDDADFDSACIFGSTMPDLDFVEDTRLKIDSLESRKLGTRVAEQLMFSSSSAYISGLLGLGNHIYANSSACATGTDAIVMGYEKIKLGSAKRVVVGSCESSTAYIWGTFDGMRVLSRKFNDFPEAASRPMSSSAGGFVPGSGAGALILEDRELAEKRGVRIYAEILGGASNSGGQRNRGTMTAPSPIGVQKCIANAIRNSDIDPASIDLIAGHLIATFSDKTEVANWAEVLNRKGKDFPFINSTKSMIGHCLGGAGSIESVAAVLELYYNFIHPSINCEDLHPEIEQLIERSCVPTSTVNQEIKTVVKANFGFGDVNSCIVFSKYQ